MNNDPYLFTHSFKSGDKVVCINTQMHRTPFGPDKVKHPLRMGAIYNLFTVHEYNIAGTLVTVSDPDEGERFAESWPAANFRLVRPDTAGDH